MPSIPSSDPLQPAAPVILPRAAHNISRSRIDPHTLQVLYRLQRAGYLAYLVGGGVRDLLLGRTPKDFDVGTNATPQQVKRLFRNCFLVGRRFRLAHVRFGPDEMVEVATFRPQATVDDLPEDPHDHRAVAENVFGTPQEDAFRRDFTINALFYDIASFSIIDHVGGLADLVARRLRVIGDPLVRFTEDPVRMLRALEFAARLDFSLDKTTREGIYTRAPLIAEAAPARIREELNELIRHAVAGKVLRQAQASGLLEPLLAGYEGDETTFALLDRIDARTAAGGPHTGWGHGEPFAAIDFAPPLTKGGCTPTEQWATAMASGVVARSDFGEVVLDLDGDGDERTGWNIFYLHVATVGRAPLGTVVNVGDPIGYPSCEGGTTTGTHIHIARKYNGEWINADWTLPFVMED